MGWRARRRKREQEQQREQVEQGERLLTPAEALMRCDVTAVAGSASAFSTTESLSKDDGD